MQNEINFTAKKSTLKNNWIKEDYKDAFQEYDCFEKLSFFKLFGISDSWSKAGEFNYNQLLCDVFTGISGENVEVVFAIVSNKYSVSIYIGITPEYSTVLYNALTATYHFIKLEKQEFESVEYTFQNIGVHGGVIIGQPTDKIKNQPKAIQIERLMKSLFGQKWAYIVAAKGVSSQSAFDLLEKVHTEMRDVYPKIKWSSSGQGTSQSENIEFTDYTAQSYLDDLTSLSGKLKDAAGNGLWRTCCYYIAENDITSRQMGKMLKSIFSGEDSVPQPIKYISLEDMGKVTKTSLGLIKDVLSHEYMNFMAVKSGNVEPYFYYAYKFQNMVGSKELAVFCQIPKLEVPGYYVDNYVEFDVSERRTGVNYSIGNIVFDGSILPNNEYKIDINFLTRHGLITGITGGGKSNTSKHLLTSLYQKHNKAFLVIESAKKEYWELGRIIDPKKLLVFTLGYEGKGSIKYRINPFERVGNTSLQTHIDYTLAAFKASFELYAPMPYVLETCVYEIYADKGWDVLNDENKYLRNEYPTLEDLYYKIEIVVDRLGYDLKLRSDIIASLQTRISSLLIGGKGAMLNTQKSFPIEIILNTPTILELEDIGDDDIKSFVIGIILVQVYEYRKSSIKTSKGLQHILLIEEAHRLLKNVITQQSSDSANPQGKAVEFFCNMLAEIRSYGQGILISDQMPTKLAPDVLKNTNLKITHRIVTEEDRKLIGSAMNMNEEQIAYISTLKTGYATVYSEGDNRPKLVKIPYVQDRNSLSREDIFKTINNSVKNIAPELFIKYRDGLACSFCSSKCKFWGRTNRLVDDEIVTRKFINGVIDFINKNGDFNADTIDTIIKKVEKGNVKRKMLTDEKLCLLNLFVEGITSVSKAYLRDAMLDYLNYSK